MDGATHSARHRWSRRPLLILAASVVNSMLIGSVWSVGIWNVVFLDHFRQSKALTAWIGSLMYTAYCVSGVFAGLVARRFSCRVAVMLGGLLSAIGCLLASLTVPMWPLFLTFGLMTGTGLGTANLGNVAILSEYFTRYIGTANAVTSTGIPLGTILSAIYLQAFLEWFSWRQAMLLYSGVLLHICVCAALLSPNPRFHKKVIAETVQVTMDDHVSDTDNLVQHVPLRCNNGNVCTESSIDEAPTPLLVSNGKDATVNGDQPLLSNIETNKSSQRCEALHSSECARTDLAVSLANHDVDDDQHWWAFLRTTFRYRWFCASVTFTFFSVSVVCVHLPADAKSRGFTDEYASSLILYAGIGSVVARVIVAVMASYFRSDTSLFLSYLVQIGGAGILAGAMPLYVHLRGSHVVFSVLFGALGQSHAAVLPPITHALVGAGNLQVALGLIYSLASAPQIVAPTFAGFICDITGSYDGTYYLTGTTLLMAFCFGVVALVIKDNKKTKTKAEHTPSLDAEL